MHIYMHIGAHQLQSHASSFIRIRYELANPKVFEVLVVYKHLFRIETQNSQAQT